MEVIVTIFGILALVVAVIAVQIVQEKNRIATWTQVAERLGLQYSPRADVIQGSLRDVAIRVFTETRGSGKSRSIWTVFEATLDGEVPFGLDLRPHHALERFLNLGGPDIELELPGVDEHLLVKAADPDEVRRWARRADISRALVDLVELKDGFHLTAVSLKIEVPLPEGDGDEIERRLEKLVDVARALSGKGYGALIDDGSW